MTEAGGLAAEEGRGVRTRTRRKGHRRACLDLPIRIPRIDAYDTGTSRIGTPGGKSSGNGIPGTITMRLRVAGGGTLAAITTSHGSAGAITRRHGIAGAITTGGSIVGGAIAGTVTMSGKVGGGIAGWGGVGSEGVEAGDGYLDKGFGGGGWPAGGEGDGEQVEAQARCGAVGAGRAEEAGRPQVSEEEQHGACGEAEPAERGGEEHAGGVDADDRSGRHCDQWEAEDEAGGGLRAGESDCGVAFDGGDRGEGRRHVGEGSGERRA